MCFVRERVIELEDMERNEGVECRGDEEGDKVWEIRILKQAGVFVISICAIKILTSKIMGMLFLWTELV